MECSEKGCGEEAILEVRYFDYVKFGTIKKNVCPEHFEEHVKFIGEKLKEIPKSIALKDEQVQSNWVAI